MAEDWTRAEVEATVADYFDMLEREVRGQEYSKTAHRRRLAALLNGRSDGAIERKHQNTSAVLIELGFVYVPGYKPLRNYQQLLFEVVDARLRDCLRLRDVVREQVQTPAAVPTVDDILESLVEPPSPDSDRQWYQPAPVRERLTPARHVDYVALEASNRSLGTAGEEFAVRYEVARLLSLSQDRLAGKVEHVSRTRGDGLGFDVLSFDASGRERFIEVKTTAYGSSTPFFVTRAEVGLSRDVGEQFQLYRTFEFRRRPRLYCKVGPIEQSFSLEPSQFVARIS